MIYDIEEKERYTENDIVFAAATDRRTSG